MADWEVSSEDVDDVTIKGLETGHELFVWKLRKSVSILCFEDEVGCIEFRAPLTDFEEFLKRLNNIVFPNGLNSSS